MIFYITSTIIGIIVGMILKNKIINWWKSIVVADKHEYDITFHAYFVIHKNGSKTNEIIKTESLTIKIVAKDEQEAHEILNDMINENTKIEIESIELWR